MRGGKGNDDDTHESGAAVLGCGDGGGAFVASSPSFASPTSEMGEELRTRLSTGASQGLPLPSNSTTPISPSVRAGNFFIGVARQPRRR